MQVVSRAGPPLVATGRWLASRGQRAWSAARAWFQGPGLQRGADRAAQLADEVSARTPFDIAAGGGRHAGFLREYAGKPIGQLSRGVQSLSSHVEAHQAYLANPASKVANFADLRPEHQQRLLTSWQSEITTAKEQIQILTHLIKSE